MKGPGSRFVDVPPFRIVETLEAIGFAVANRGGSAGWLRKGGERVFRIDLRRDFPTPSIFIYTTIPVDGSKIRACGDDAVRVVVGVRESADVFTPTRRSTKVLRTAPKAGDRLKAFLDRMTDAVREAYRAAKVSRPCPECGRPLVERRSIIGLFVGCSGFPTCRYKRMS